MARVKGPLFSLQASGNTTGAALQFRTTPQGCHVYRPMDPREQNQTPPSPAQEAQRRKFKAACDAWSALGDEDKAYWSLRSITTGRTGFTAFIADTMRPDEGL
jgi:hypothetical protein